MPARCWGVRVLAQHHGGLQGSRHRPLQGYHSMGAANIDVFCGHLFFTHTHTTSLDSHKSPVREGPLLLSLYRGETEAQRGLWSYSGRAGT